MKITDVVKTIFNTKTDDITCDECFEHIDEYVDMIHAGQDPSEVLPQVKSHLEQCRCCEMEFRALISILEGEIDHADSG
ncbi:MAG: hypothetical protein JXJ17_19250 [Anaerolineae bacterium]|nr:hypothetical protein [Anaerolineae bacterium]